ncbi:MAG: O-antigen ligase family protein [Ignavibacteriae bacterium]|nr:O-antigen ligase family protein [Ignavibacteriota bacterium]
MRASLLLFAFSLPFSHVPVQFAVVLTVIGWLAHGILNKQWLVRKHPVFIPMIAYITWNALSSLISPRPAHSFFAMLDNEWPMIGMVLLFWIVNDAEFLKKVVLAFLISASAAMLYAVSQSVTGIDFLRPGELTSIGFGFYRSTGFYGFYLTFAALAMATFFIAGAQVLERRRWTFVLIAVAAFLAIIGSFARSIWIAVALIVPLFAFLRGRRFGTYVTLSLVSLVLIASLTIPAFYVRIVSIVDLGQNQTRLNLWKSAVAMASDHPLLGVGEDNWDFFFEHYRVQGGFYDTTVHPHNDYLNVLANSGVPGLILFVTIWAMIIHAGVRAFRRRRDHAIGAVGLGSTVSIIGLMIAAFFQNYYGTFINCFLWWFLAGLVLVASKLSVGEAERD